jgi:predicted GH43/DUF377 family glycosyl hydrolase
MTPFLRSPGKETAANIRRRPIVAPSPDLRNWSSHKLLLEARKGAWWDANKIGLSLPLIETHRCGRGWQLAAVESRLVRDGSQSRQHV